MLTPIKLGIHLYVTYANCRTLLVRGDIIIIGHQATQAAFKNCAPFTKCVTKIAGTAIPDAEDLVMPMYNLIEYCSNYSETTGSLWFYSKHEATYFNADIVNNNDFKSFKYKAKLLGNTFADGANGILKNATIAIPLKYLSDFWIPLKISLIKCKVELKRKWIKYCVLPAAGTANDDANSNNIIFTIKASKLLLSKTCNVLLL